MESIDPPKLFLVDRQPNNATLYFEPVLGSDGYVIYYGEDQSINDHSVTLDKYADHTGVVSQTISDLDSEKKYYYGVAATAGGSVGPTSKVLGDSDVIYYENTDVENILKTNDINEKELVVQKPFQEDLSNEGLSNKDQSAESEGKDENEKNLPNIGLLTAGSVTAVIIFLIFRRKREQK